MSDPIADVLARQRACLESLREVLEAEHRALLAADAGALPALADGKTRLFSEIEALEARRRDSFGAAAVKARADWTLVRSLADDVARANQRNGAMISALMRGADGALQILRGVADTGSFYGRQGLSTQAGGTSRPLADA